MRNESVDVDRLWIGVVAREPDACVEVLAARNPSWLLRWVTTLCERDPQFAWPLAHGLRVRGLFAGDGPGYALAFIAGVAGNAWREGKSIDDALRANLALLEDELWRAFQIEGGGETSFAAHDKYASPETSWSAALRRLADEGAIDRQRLIDATLDALARGYSAFRAGWFVRFHDELDLTDDERRPAWMRTSICSEARRRRCSRSPSRPWPHWTRWSRSPRLRLVRALRPAVLNRAKATASQALRLVDAAAGRAQDASAAGRARRGRGAAPRGA